MGKRLNTPVFDGGSDYLRTVAGTLNRLKLHLLKTDVNLVAAAVAANTLGNVAMVAADFVQSTSGLDRVTTIAAKSIALTGNSTQYDEGTSTGGNTAAVIKDTTKAWTVNEHIGRAVVILAGTGAGQARTIQSNSATQIDVNVLWTTTPDATSQYAIRDDLHIILFDETAGVILVQTSEATKQVVVSGNTFNVPAWTFTIKTPT